MAHVVCQNMSQYWQRVKNILSACKVGSKNISHDARYVKGKVYPRTGHEGPEGE